MGQTKSSQYVAKGLTKTENDFELVIRTSKELEHLLDNYMAAQGKGLHEKTNSVEDEISSYLSGKLHYIATIRNKLVHERDFNAIPNRNDYIKAFEEAQKELAQAIEQSHHAHRGGAGSGGGQKKKKKRKTSDGCVIQ